MKKITVLSIVFALMTFFNSFGYVNWFRNWADEPLLFEVDWTNDSYCSKNGGVFGISPVIESTILQPKKEKDFGSGPCCWKRLRVSRPNNSKDEIVFEKSGVGRCSRSVYVVYKNPNGTLRVEDET